MSNISNQPQHITGETGFAGYVRKQSVHHQQSLDTGLTIKTREGDVVTLSSSSYSSMDAFSYDSQGVLRTRSGDLAVSGNMREITLETGESFSFSVKGDLSEKELEDIEAIVKGIDEIVFEVAEGDMDDAVVKALSMGGYDTISMYSADITRTETTAWQTSIAARSEGNGYAGNRGIGPDSYRVPEMTGNGVYSPERMFEKMAGELEKFEERLVEKSRNPVDKLLKHYKDREELKAGNSSPRYALLEDFMKEISSLMDHVDQSDQSDQDTSTIA